MAKLIAQGQLTITNVDDGAPGAPGEKAKYVIVYGEQAFKKAKGSSIFSPTSVTLTAQRFNLSSEVGQWYSIVGGTTTDLGTGATKVITPEGTLASGGLNTANTGIIGYKVDTTIGGVPTTIRDEITVIKLVDGSDGANPITMLLTNENHTVIAGSDGSVIAGNLANAKTDIYIYEGITDVTSSWSVTASTVTGVTGAVSGTTPKTYTVSAFSNTPDSAAITLTATRSGYPTMTKTFSLSKAKTGSSGSNGNSAISAIISNGSHTFPASSAGAVSSYTGSGTQIRVYEGATELAYDGVGTSNSSWKVATTPTNITVGTLTDSGTYLTVGDHSAVASGTDTSSIDYTITGKSSNGTSFTTVVKQTFTKSKAGATGGSGAAAQYVVVNGEQAFKYDSTGTITGSSSIVLTASLFGGLTTYDWEYWNGTAWANLGGTQTAATYTLAHNATEWGINKALRVRCLSGSQYDEITILKLYDGAAGSPGTPGVSYTLNIVGGARGIAYAADGTSPKPATTTAYSVELLKNGTAVTPFSYSWTCGGSLSSATITTATFTPTIKTTIDETGTFVQVVVKEVSGGPDITQRIAVVATKYADGLDWLADWNTGTTTIQNDKIASPRIFAGTNSGTNLTPNLTGVALGKNVLTGADDLIGLVGYKNNTAVFKLGTDATFLVSPTGNAGAVTAGTGNGIYFDGTTTYITGKMVLQGGSGFAPGANVIDGRNLAVYGAVANYDASTTVDNATFTKDGGAGIARTAVANGGAIVDRYVYYQTGKKYVISMKVMAATTGITSFQIYNGYAHTNSKVFIDGVEKGVMGSDITHTFTQNTYYTITIYFTAAALGTKDPSLADSNKTILQLAKTQSTLAYTAEILNLKIEEGTTATGWAPAPEDVNKDLAEVGSVADSAASTASGASNLASQAKDALDKVTLEVGGNVYIKGDMIADGTLTANAINAGNFQITNSTTKEVTFEVESSGNVNIKGNVQSFGYVPGVSGWQLLADGNAELNNAVIRSSVMLPNAGITNFGAGSFNDNILKDSSFALQNKFSNWTLGTGATIAEEGYDSGYCLKTVGALASTKNADQNLSVTLNEIKVNTQYTASFWFKKSNIVRGTTNCFIRLYIAYYSGATYKSEAYISADLSAAGSADWTKYTTTFTTRTTADWDRAVVTCYARDFTGTVWFDEIKIESGATATEWTPHTSEKGHLVRFWAGTDYSKRHRAPFRVLQSGDIIVEKGEFKGTVTGQIDIGNIYMDNDEMSFYQSSDRSTPVMIKVNNDNTFFNVKKFSIGDNTSTTKLLLEGGTTNLLTLSNLKTTMDNSNGGKIIFNDNSVANNNIIMNTISPLTGGGKHRIKYHNGYSGLIFESLSAPVQASTEIPYDFKFENGAVSGGKANVKVQGTLLVTDKITMFDNQSVYLEAKDDANGKGFDLIVI